MELVVNGELYHHGVIGQKWGVRRYQNKDGTLTAKGKRRYVTSKEQKNFDDKLKILNDAERVHGYGSKQYNKANKNFEKSKKQLTAKIESSQWQLLARQATDKKIAKFNKKPGRFDTAVLFMAKHDMTVDEAIKETKASYRRDKVNKFISVAAGTGIAVVLGSVSGI